MVREVLLASGVIFDEAKLAGLGALACGSRVRIARACVQRCHADDTRLGVTCPHCLAGALAAGATLSASLARIDCGSTRLRCCAALVMGA